MKEISILNDKIEDELEDACAYIDLALEYKDSDPGMADLFYRLSGEEMTHMDLLHGNVKSKIEKYRREHGEPPVAMMAVYEHLHKRFNSKAERILNKQHLYKR